MSQLKITNESSTPAAPGAGKWSLYSKLAGIFFLHSSGLEIGPVSTEWIPVFDTWTYASATTINVPTNATLTYQKGDKVRFKQGGSYKYGYLTTIAATLLTFNGGTDYSVANSAITDIAFCRGIQPFGFPSYFNYTPSITVITLGDGTLAGKFKITGTTVDWWCDFTFGTTSAMGSGAPTFTNPVTLTAIGDALRAAGLILDSGTIRYDLFAETGTTSVAVYAVDTSTTYAKRTALSSTIPMTWATGDKISFQARGIMA